MLVPSRRALVSLVRGAGTGARLRGVEVNGHGQSETAKRVAKIVVVTARFCVCVPSRSHTCCGGTLVYISGRRATQKYI